MRGPDSLRHLLASLVMEISQWDVREYIGIFSSLQGLTSQRVSCDLNRNLIVTPRLSTVRECSVTVFRYT
jgi:hypothetical protein